MNDEEYDDSCTESDNGGHYSVYNEDVKRWVCVLCEKII